MCLLLSKAVKYCDKVIVQRKGPDCLDQFIVVTIRLGNLALIGSHKETVPGHFDEVGRQPGIGDEGAQSLQHLARPDRHLGLGLEEMTRRDGGQGLGPVLEAVGVVDAMILLDGQLVVEKVKCLLDAVAPEQAAEDGCALKWDHGRRKVGAARFNGALGQVVLVDTEGRDGKSSQQIALEAISEGLVGPLEQESSERLDVMDGLGVAGTLDGLDHVIGRR